MILSFSGTYQLIPMVVVLLWDKVPVLEHLGLFLPWALRVSVLYDKSSLC